MELLTAQTLPSVHGDIYLRIQPKKAVYATAYSTDGKTWIPLQEVDGKFLSTETAGGFVGSVFGLYATSLGKESRNKAFYDSFVYEGNDAVFRTAAGKGSLRQVKANAKITKAGNAATGTK